MSQAPPSAPQEQVVRKTFRLELLRAVPSGVLETAATTFAILIVIRHYNAGPAVKSLLLGSPHAGLLASFLVVPLLHRISMRTGSLVSLIYCAGGAGFLAAAAYPESMAVYLAGVFLGLFSLTFQVPLLTHIYRHNYPEDRRGRLFSIAIILRSGVAIGFSQLGGWLLGIEFSWFRILLLTFAGASFAGAWCMAGMPAAPLGK